MIRTLIIMAFATLFLNNVKAQNLTTAQVDSLINSKHYTFKAERMNPQRGGQKYLTSEYFLRVAGDSLISALPYFGRAYTAPINPEDAGYDFTSTNFNYNVVPKKKGSHQITINTKDKMNTVTFVLTVYNNGNSYLQVTSVNRQPISYTGYLKTAKK
jgi:uncharacterized protein DUF4251